MQAMAQLDRASFMYGSNDQMTSEVKDALSAFDLNKTGSVSTSELVAGAKALQEVRGQNSFMRKILLIHAVTMGLLLAGMFGLSMAAMELSKETKVGAEGALVSQQGEAVLVGSSDMHIVPGANGSPELRQRPSGDARRLGESDGELVMVGHPAKAMLDLTFDDEDDGSRRLYDDFNLQDIYDPGQKYKVYARLNFNKATKLFNQLENSINPSEFTLKLPGIEYHAYIVRRANTTPKKLSFLTQVTRSDGHTEIVYVRCEDKNRGKKPCIVFFKKDDRTPFILDDGDKLCMKYGQCDTKKWAKIKWDVDGTLDLTSNNDDNLPVYADVWETWAEIGFDAASMEGFEQDLERWWYERNMTSGIMRR
jgi:hypothetical protein